MTTYATGNPIGSTAVKDLYDNAENFDAAVNDRTNDNWTDRLGHERKTWSGIERLADANTAIAAATRAEEAADRAEDAANVAMASSQTIWVDALADVPPGPHPDRNPIMVLADPNDDGSGNVNGLYYWDAATNVPIRAPDSSQPANIGRVVELEQRTDEAFAQIAAIPVVRSQVNEQDSFIFRDPTGKVGPIIKSTNVTESGGLRATGLTTDPFALNVGQFKILQAMNEMRLGEETGIRVIQNDEYWIAYVDSGNRLAMGIKWSGETVIGSLAGYVKSADFEALSGRVAALEQGGTTGGGQLPFVGYVEGNEIHAYAVDGTESLVIDLTSRLAPVANPGVRIEGRKALFLSNKPELAASSPAALALDARPDGSRLIVNPDEKICYLIPSIGQSNSVGSRGVPVDIPLLLSQVYERLLMPETPGELGVRLGAGGAYDPNTTTQLLKMKSTFYSTSSTEGYGLGVTHVEGMGYRLAYEFRKRFGFDPMIVAFTAGIGGRLYRDLKKGTVAYNNMMLAVQRVKELVEAAGYRLVVPCVVIVHGESDSGLKEYRTGIYQWQVDMDADIRAITGQAAMIPCVCSQASVFQNDLPEEQLFGTGGIDGTNVGRRIWGVYPTYDACKSRTTHHMAGVYYNLQFANVGPFDGLHLGNYGHSMNGEYIALTIMSTIFGTKDFGTIMPKKTNPVTFNGTNQVDITFDVPVGGLVRDESISDPGGWGFELFDGDGWSMTNPDVHPGVTVTPQILAPDTIRLTCSEPVPAGPQRAVGYALHGWTLPKESNPGMGPRGQIRDENTETSIILPGAPLYHWMPHFLEMF